MLPLCPLNQQDSSTGGFTLIELMVVIAILATLSAIAIPNYLGSREKAKIAAAIADCRQIEKVAIIFMADHGRYPNSLAEAGLGTPSDPWGNPYVYYPMSNIPKGTNVRKDRFLVPINTDFDLYSLGADGRSVGPLTAKHSHDDIVRANNGGYIGLAKYY